MNQDSSFPPMLPPSSELGALLFAVLPCLQETYRPLASFAYHMTELTKMKSIPSVPSFSGLSGIDALITDKDIMLRSLSFYGRMFHMPLLSTIANLLQGMQFYQAYKDILPGLFSGMSGCGGDPSSAFGSMAGLFSGLGGLGGFGGATDSGTPGTGGSDFFSMFGGLSPDLLSSLFFGFSGGGMSCSTPPSASEQENPSDCLSPSAPEIDTPSNDITIPKDDISPNNAFSTVSEENFAEDTCNEEPPVALEEIPPDTTSSDPLYDTLYSFLTPEQQKIYEQLMHTD